MELFKRFELKYRVQDALVPAVRDALISFGMVEDNEAKKYGTGFYIVNSLYFDSIALRDYYDKSGGFIDREKIRMRMYGTHLTDETKHVWLENKMKHDMTISKKRGPLNVAEYDLVRVAPQKFIADASLPQEYSIVKTIAKKIVDRSMKPHLLVRYKRIPLVSKTAPHFRVTFDSNIESCQKGDLRYNYAMHRVAPGMTIMEVKFSVFLPPWFRKILEEFSLKREAFSKYAHGMDAARKLNPLPR